MENLKFAKKNYEELRPILDALNRRSNHISVENKPYTRLAAEYLYFADYKDRPVYYIAHHSEQNGDLMYSRRLRTALDEFLYDRLQNLKRQGFIKLVEEL